MHANEAINYLRHPRGSFEPVIAASWKVRRDAAATATRAMDHATIQTSIHTYNDCVVILPCLDPKTYTKITTWRHVESAACMTRICLYYEVKFVKCAAKCETPANSVSCQ
jgi:hypothetical protein